MATYQGAAHVASQLESILANTRLPDELIIVDDHSTDGTLDVVQRILKNTAIRTVEIVKKDMNSGVTETFVQGILRSTGDLIFLADQDDYWAPDKIETMLSVYSSDPNTSLVYSDGTITDAHLVNTNLTIFGTRRRAQLKLGDKRDRMEIAADPDIKGCTMAIRGSLARELLVMGPIDFRPFWGHDHWLALFCYGLGKVVVVDRALIQHRFHDQNTSGGAKLRFSVARDRRKWMERIRGQQVDFFSQRYRVAIRYAGSFGPRFSSSLKEALQKMLALSERREALKRLPFIKRAFAAVQIHREGLYTAHYNGILTLMRDVFL